MNVETVSQWFGTMRRRVAFSALLCTVSVLSAPPSASIQSTSPQPYVVTRNEAVLSLRTPFYTIEHDLKRGGVIHRITLQHGKATNLLVEPLQTRVRLENGVTVTDLRNAGPTVTHRREGLSEIVVIEGALVDEQGKESDLSVRTTFEYRWGYVRIRKELHPPSAGAKVTELTPLATSLTASLSEYGYRPGVSEEDGEAPFSFGSNRWGKLRAGSTTEPALDTRNVPRSMIFANPGVEGLEWFAGSDLMPWERLSGRRGRGQCLVRFRAQPAGIQLALSPFLDSESPFVLTNTVTWTSYLGLPLLEGHAFRPWLHTSFNRNQGNWVSSQQMQEWARSGIQTVHCHNDGDYYADGLFWRDGSYPPYPDMAEFNQVLEACHTYGLRTATYFSNKELHPSTEEFKAHGREWGRMDRRGALQHNFYKPQSEFGAQMCLRSGWLDFLKLSIDRVLKNHPLDGVYYDWNVALYCANALHEGRREPGTNAQGHWDMDELLDLMEWTRERVGTNGLIIVHNTTTPMFALENFADHVVATEWGYQKWTDRAPALDELPLEWSLVGARSRGVISYGTIDSSAPKRLHRMFALQALLGGVTPWPADHETFELMPLLRRVTDPETTMPPDLNGLKFADWRNNAVKLSDPRTAAAVYSRADHSYLLIANLDPTPKDVICTVDPARLPMPLPQVGTALVRRLNRTLAPARMEMRTETLDIARLVGAGAPLSLPADDAILIGLFPTVLPDEALSNPRLIYPFP